jgi:hypothetical protein
VTVANGHADFRTPQPPILRKTILDVAVIYTETAKCMEGGDAEIHNLIGLSIFQRNVAFVNSGSNIRIRLRLVKTLQDRSFPAGMRSLPTAMVTLTTGSESKKKLEQMVSSR